MRQLREPQTWRHTEVSMKSREHSRRFFARPLESRGSAARGRHIPRWFWLVAGVWLAWVTVLSDHSFWRITQLRHEIGAAEREAERLRRDTEHLDEQVNDPDAKRFRAEEIARTQHGWAAPGELVYRFRGTETIVDSTR
jgi:cell division protein FtsB